LKDFLLSPLYYGGKNLDCFVKAIDGECGEGVFHLIKEGTICKVHGKEVSVEDLEEKFLKKGSFIFQLTFKQHPELSKIYPHSVNTLRIVTIQTEKGIITLPSTLRVGAMGNEVDNYSQGGVIIEVDSTGKLTEWGLRKPKFGTKSKTHPDTGIEYKGLEIPYFKEAEALAIRFHSMLSDLTSIGWDIAITEDGPFVIEGNDNWEMQLPQMNHGLKREWEECVKFYKNRQS